MQTPSDLREKYGSVYISELSDGILVPWKALSVKDYIDYANDLQRGFITKETIYLEIFNKCVVDDFIKKNINKQKAGTIETVVDHIIRESGPSNPNDFFNAHLNFARNTVNSNIFHTAVGLICAAFPGYKPEEVYQLEYPDLMVRLAQAELHLLRIGYLEEPLAMAELEGENKSPPPKIENSQLKSIFDRQEQEKQQLEQQAAQRIRKNQRKVQEEISPPQKNKTKDGRLVVTKEEMQVRQTVGDMDEAPFLEHQMLEEAAEIYKDYLEDVKAGKKVIIKSPEERLKERKMKSKTRQSKLKQTAGK